MLVVHEVDESLYLPKQYEFAFYSSSVNSHILIPYLFYAAEP